MLLRALSLLLLTSLTSAQISFTHENRGQVAVTGYSRFTGSASQSLPVGPLPLPVNLNTGTSTNGSLSITSLLTSSALIRAQAAAASVDLNGSASAVCDVRTRVFSPRPARVQLSLLPASNPGVGSGLVRITVDVGSDGSVEYCSGFCAGGTTTSFELLVDSRGVSIDWHIYCYAAGVRLSGAPISSSAALDLRFSIPAHEADYGTACGGELGVTVTPGVTFGRSFLGFVPATTTFAWIVLGNQPTNLTFSGIPCPLLCDPDVVGSVALRSAAGGQRYFEFQEQLPALPGASWFTQAVGIDSGVFFGTNGVHIRT